MGHAGQLVGTFGDVGVEMNAQDLVREVERTCLVKSSYGRITLESDMRKNVIQDAQQVVKTWREL